MANPQLFSDDVSKRYKDILWIAGLDAQDFSFNEMQDILDRERERLGTRVFKPGAILTGMVPSLPGAGVLTTAEGQVYVQGRVEPIPAASLAYDPDKVIGTDTVYLRWLLDQVTQVEDPSLEEPGTGDVIDERLRVTVSAVAANPDVLDEAFDDFVVSGDDVIPRDWSFSGAGGVQRGYPARFGETAVRITHVTGTETKLEREIVLTPSTPYRVYFQVRSAPGSVDLALGHGAFVDMERTSPSFTPADHTFAASPTYARNTFTVTSDASAAAVRVRIVIPALAPSTSILFDGLLITTAALAALDWDRHYIPLMFWDRATDVITRAITRISNLRGADLEPPFLGEDIIGLPRNQELQDELAVTVFDENDHYRIPPGLETQRDPSLDDSTHVGVRVTAGRAYVRGYRVTKNLATLFPLDKALTTQAIDSEAQTFHFGTNLYATNKAAGATRYPIQQLRAVTMDTLQVIQVTKGTGGGTDTLSVGNITDILAADGGNGAAAGSLTGTQPGPFVFTEANRRLRVKVTAFDASAGAFQEISFARGSYTRTEVMEALQRGSGRAYRSGKIVGNVVFADTGSAIKISTLTRHSAATVQVDSEANGSTGNTLLGFASGGVTSSDGAGTHYAETTDWVRAGGDLSWSPGGAEPTTGHTVTVVVRRTIPAVANTDYKLGGLFVAGATDHYIVTAWGASGEGLGEVSVSRVRVAGDINRLTWLAVANALSYHVYRSANGVNYDLLRNVVDPTAGAGTGSVALDDDGSLTPDSSVHPPSSPSTTSGRANTTLSGAVTAGATSIVVIDSTGFPNAGTAFLGGSDHFTYTGRTDTTFTGIPSSGAGSIGASHADGALVSQGPTMGTLTLALGNLGVVNFNPQGAVLFTATRGEPEDSRSVLVDYDYFQPRIDRLVIDRFAVIRAISGEPADNPMAPAIPNDVMELAQLSVQPGPNQTPPNDVRIARINATTRTTMGQLRQMADRVERLEAQSIDQSIRNPIAAQDASAKGIFSDGLAGLDLCDPDYDRDGVTFNASVDTVLRVLGMPQAIDQRTVSNGTLARASGTSTDASIGQFRVLPSSEIVLLEQAQWSEVFPVNPYSAFTGRPAEIVLTPDHVVWSLKPTGGALPFFYLAEVNLVLAALRNSVISTGESIPPWITDLQAVLEEAKARVSDIRRTVPLTFQDALSFVLNFSRQPFTPAGHLTLEDIQVRFDGAFFGASEDNIALTFDGSPVTIDSGDIVTGTAATQSGKLKAAADGTFAFTGGPGSGGWLSAIGIHEFGMTGPARNARASFTGMLTLPPGLRVSLYDPLAQSFSFPILRTVSAVGLWFDSKATDGQPITVQIREMVGGFPSPAVLAQHTVFPGDVTIGSETKVSFDRYVTIPADTSVAITLVTSSSQYSVQIARLNKTGKNPVVAITNNPYDAGTLFSSPNNESWVVHPDADLRMKLYGRTFGSSAVLEFAPVTGLTASDLWVGADQRLVANTKVTWEYELNGSGVARPFEAFEKRLLDVVGTSAIIRAKLSTTDANASPAIVLPSVGLAAFTNALAGTYVSIATTFTQELTTGRFYFVAAIPSGTTVTGFLSNDDGITWAPVVVDTPTVIDDVWSSYACKIDPGSNGGEFADTAKSVLRLRLELVAADRLVVPRVGRIGASVS